MEYDEFRRLLEDETGSPMIINAILAQEDEKATYGTINDYVSGFPYPEEDAVEARLHSLQAFGLVSTEEQQILGEEPDEVYFQITDQGEELLREDMPNYDRYRAFLKHMNRFND